MPASTSKFAQLDNELSKAAVKCKVCRILDELDDDDAAYVRAMMARPITEKGHKHISTVLAAGGVDVSATTISECRTARHQPRD